jgi:hypothetical protein
MVIRFLYLAPMQFQRLKASVLLLLACVVLSEPNLAQESMTLGIIDFYGLRSLTEEEVLTVLPYSIGDRIEISESFPQAGVDLEMAEALQVSRIELSPICCTTPNTFILYIGVEEEPSIGRQYLPEPTGDLVLPLEIQETARQLESAIIAAVRAGDAGEDRSQGHSLMMNADARSLQERYVEYADEYREMLIEVLHESAIQRDLAATVLAYASDKKAIVPHLEMTVLDSNAEVRNNAMRALGLIAQYAVDHPELEIALDATVFVDMLNSVVFGDRNKASFVLLALTESRAPAVIQQIQEEALFSLVEMCRWESDGHAWVPCKILERVVGLPDQDELHPKEETVGAALALSGSQASQ